MTPKASEAVIAYLSHDSHPEHLPTPQSEQVLIESLALLWGVEHPDRSQPVSVEYVRAWLRSKADKLKEASQEESNQSSSTSSS